MNARPAPSADRGACRVAEIPGSTDALVRPAALGCDLPNLPGPVATTGEPPTLAEYLAWDAHRTTHPTHEG